MNVLVLDGGSSSLARRCSMRRPRELDTLLDQQSGRVSPRAEIDEHDDRQVLPASEELLIARDTVRVVA